MTSLPSYQQVVRNYPRAANQGDFIKLLINAPEMLGGIVEELSIPSVSSISQTICGRVKFKDCGRINFARNGRFVIWYNELGPALQHFQSCREPSSAKSAGQQFIAVVGSDFPAMLEWQGSWSALFLTFSQAILIDALPAGMRLTDVDQNWGYVLNDQDLIQTIKAIGETLAVDGPTMQTFREELACAFLREVFSRCQNVGAHKGASRNGLRSKDLHRVCEVIEENLHRKLTLSELAKEISTSPRNFCRSFKQSTGVSPYQYILMRRIEIAKERLRQPGTVSLAALALDIGFCDQSQLSVMFKKHTGMTLKEYTRL